jgi:hypothetical protein
LIQDFKRFFIRLLRQKLQVMQIIYVNFYLGWTPVMLVIQSAYAKTLVYPEGSVLSHPLPLTKLETPCNRALPNFIR